MLWRCIKTAIKYRKEDQWTEYYLLPNCVIVKSEGGFADVLRKVCPQCQNEMIITFYDNGAFISAFKMQIRINPTKQVVCERCDPKLRPLEKYNWDDPVILKRKECEKDDDL